MFSVYTRTHVDTRALPMMSDEKRVVRILAIDPGFDRMGIAVVEGDASKPVLVWSDCVMPARGEAEERLSAVQKAAADAIEQYSPHAVALETLFFSSNVKSAMGVAQARGAVLAAAGSAGCRVIECSPQEVKLAVTGYGAADKKSVGMMVPKLISLPPKKRLDDELDAIALGIAALARKNSEKL
jgi:crossover junction endodeoxyribonuclease RuvC